MTQGERPRQMAEHEALADRILRWRDARGLSQQALADRAGFARSTLSKIENGQLSPSFEILLKLARGFDTDLSDLLRPESPGLTGRMVIERGTVTAPMDDGHTRLWPLAGALKSRAFQSAIVEFTQTGLADFGPWNSHDTEDMLFVLSGELVLHSEGYETARLRPGDSVHFDGTMPHACLAGGPAPCRCLYVFATR